MTAVTESGLLADIGKIKIGKAEKVFCSLQSYLPDELAAGLPIIFFKSGREMGITHMKMTSQICDRNIFLVMLENILCYICKFIIC